MVEMTQMAHAHSYVTSVQSFVQAVTSYNGDASVKAALQRMCRLYALYQLERQSGDFIRFNIISSGQVRQIRNLTRTLLKDVRTDAIGYVDAFNWSDRMLGSVLGRYDGNVYENLLKWAKRDPRNTKGDVLDGYVESLQPMIQSQL
eukprot:GFYU01030423.1.p1 GENE.GFYU01030423.1~~GFYU01030423.1.p1  ORF type:complete len:156 (-),score=33.56 GFYU01030423.1:140-577(-)